MPFSPFITYIINKWLLRQISRAFLVSSDMCMLAFHFGGGQLKCPFFAFEHTWNNPAECGPK